MIGGSRLVEDPGGSKGGGELPPPICYDPGSAHPCSRLMVLHLIMYIYKIIENNGKEPEYVDFL